MRGTCCSLKKCVGPWSENCRNQRASPKPSTAGSRDGSGDRPAEGSGDAEAPALTCAPLPSLTLAIFNKDLLATLHLLVALARRFQPDLALPPDVRVEVITIEVTGRLLQWTPALVGAVWGDPGQEPQARRPRTAVGWCRKRESGYQEDPKR